MPWIGYTRESTGSEGLRRFIDEFQPDLLLCDHIHEDRGEAWIGSIRIINVGEMGRGYGAVVERDDEINIRWIGPKEKRPKKKIVEMLTPPKRNLSKSF